MLLSPDQLLLAGLAAVVMVAGIVYHTGSLAEERRRRPQPRPLGPNRLVQIDAGPLRGLCGWVQEITRDAATGREQVKIELNDGRVVQADRPDVSALFG